MSTHILGSLNDLSNMSIEQKAVDYEHLFPQFFDFPLLIVSFTIPQIRQSFQVVDAKGNLVSRETVKWFPG